MIFIYLYYFFLGFIFITLMQRVAKQQDRPLASFSTMKFIDYRVSQLQPDPQLHPDPQPQQPVIVVVVEKQKKLKFTIKKKHTPETVTPDTPDTSDTPDTPDTPVEKQKLKITIVKRKHSLTKNPTKKIKITIKKQPKQKEEEQQCFDIAPPVTMFYRPYSDYIAPPPKCCRFFIENRHCFLRSSDNACIDPITKNVFGFWNCEIGKNCELLPPADDDDVQDDEVNNDIANLLKLDNSDNSDDDDYDYNKRITLAMRQKSDANRARFTGQPVALLRQKIATNYGMHSFNSLGNRR